MPTVILTLVLVWLLLKKKKNPISLAYSEEPISFEETIEPVESELDILEIERDNSEIEKIPVSTINIGESDSYHYKVYEEHNGNANEDKQYHETYYFKTGNLLKRKFDAEDWYNRRTITITNRKTWLQSQQPSNVKFGTKLYFVDSADSENVKDYLLKDELGIDNKDNRLFEAITLERAGYDRNSLVKSIIHQNNYGTVNSFLNGETPRTFIKT